MSMRIAIRCNNRFWCSDDDGVEGNSGWYSDSGISTFTIDELPAVLKEIDVDCCGVIELVPVYFPDTEPVAAVLPIEPECEPIDLRDHPVGTRVRLRNGMVCLIDMQHNRDQTYCVTIESEDREYSEPVTFDGYVGQGQISDYDVVEVLS